LICWLALTLGNYWHLLEESNFHNFLMMKKGCRKNHFYFLFFDLLIFLQRDKTHIFLQDFETLFHFRTTSESFPVGDKYMLLFENIKDSPSFWTSIGECYKKAVTLKTKQWKALNVSKLSLHNQNCLCLIYVVLTY
jgi:hypothetical protein